MKSLFQYITESVITEFKTDLMPQCVVVMGGPGAGKTFWLDRKPGKNDYPCGNAQDFFKNNITPVKLDTDHNLEKFQKEHVNKLCEKLLLAIATDENDSIRKKKFNQLIKTEQKEMDSAVAGKSRTIDISPIDFYFVKTFADKYKNAPEYQREKIMSDYKYRFTKTYFKSIFASDFSVRQFSKAEYKQHFNQKLKGEVEGLEFIGPRDVVIAITGDDIQKFKDIVDVCGQTHSITVVYLNVPEEMSIRQDAGRDRSLGEKLVKKILYDVRDTWEQLVGEYESLGITKLVELKTDPDLKNPHWELENEYINYDLIKRK